MGSHLCQLAVSVGSRGEVALFEIHVISAYLPTAVVHNRAHQDYPGRYFRSSLHIHLAPSCLAQALASIDRSLGCQTLMTKLRQHRDGDSCSPDEG
jgi:hypothetical protein